jgi:hypothetical protein
MKIRRLRTVTQIEKAIDEAKGPGHFRALIKNSKPNLKRGKQSFANYRASNRLPHDTFKLFEAELTSIACSAPSSLWDITELPKARAAA